MGVKWSEQELSFLQNNYHKFRVSWLSKEMNKPTEEIYRAVELLRKLHLLPRRNAK